MKEDVDFWFPLYSAAIEAKASVYEWLIEHGAKVDVRATNRIRRSEPLECKQPTPRRTRCD